MMHITPKKYVKSLFFVIWSSVLAPLSNTIEFLKGICVFFYSLIFKKHYTINDYLCNNILPLPTADFNARLFPYTLNTARLGGFLLTALCIIGFLGMVAVPIFGIAPIYCFSIITIAKAYGITLGSTLIGRFIGGFIGSIMDSFYNTPLFYKLSHIIKPKKSNLTTKKEFILKTTIAVGLTGENCQSLGHVICKPINFFQEQIFHKKELESPISNSQYVYQTSISTNENVSVASETQNLAVKKRLSLYSRHMSCNAVNSHRIIKKSLDMKPTFSSSSISSLASVPFQFSRSHVGGLEFSIFYRNKNLSFDTGDESNESPRQARLSLT
jgi:hypothetical protein